MTGKCNRGLSVVDSYKLLKGADALGEEETFLACTLGWCIEWVFFFLSPTVARKNASQGTESGSSKFARRISASGFLSCA
jgi:hypothetical protein